MFITTYLNYKTVIIKLTNLIIKFYNYVVFNILTAQHYMIVFVSLAFNYSVNAE